MRNKSRPQQHRHRSHTACCAWLCCGRWSALCSRLNRAADFDEPSRMSHSITPGEKAQLLVRWRAWDRPTQKWRSIWFFADVARVADSSRHAHSLLRSKEEAGIAERLADLGDVRTPLHLLRYHKDNESWWTNLLTVRHCVWVDWRPLAPGSICPHCACAQIVYYTRGQGSISAISSDGSIIQGKRTSFSSHLKVGDFIWLGRLPPVHDAIKVCELRGF